MESIYYRNNLLKIFLKYIQKRDDIQIELSKEEIEQLLKKISQVLISQNFIDNIQTILEKKSDWKFKPILVSDDFR